MSYSFVCRMDAYQVINKLNKNEIFYAPEYMYMYIHINVYGVAVWRVRQITQSQF